VDRVAENHFQRLPTARVNATLERATNAHQPPVDKNRRVKIYFGTQVKTAPPTFVFASNNPRGIHFSYRRYLKNQFRDAFDFEGSPIRLIFRQRESQYAPNIPAKKRKGKTPRRHGKRKKTRRG
jgi:GTP-binding protein